MRRLKFAPHFLLASDGLRLRGVSCERQEDFHQGVLRRRRGRMKVAFYPQVRREAMLTASYREFLSRGDRFEDIRLRSEIGLALVSPRYNADKEFRRIFFTK